MQNPGFLEASATANIPIRYLDPEAHAATLATSSEDIRALWEKAPWQE
jgi:hypothetical protein